MGSLFLKVSPVRIWRTYSLNRLFQLSYVYGLNAIAIRYIIEGVPSGGRWHGSTHKAHR